MGADPNVRPDEALLSDSEVRERLRSNPDVMRRAEELARRVREGSTGGPRIAREELADFLREHQMDT